MDACAQPPSLAVGRTAAVQGGRRIARMVLAAIREQALPMPAPYDDELRALERLV